MRICFYTFQSPVTRYVARLLMASGRLSAVILQSPMTASGKVRLLARRAHRYGLAKAIDELCFSVYHRLFVQGADERLRRAVFPRGFSAPLAAGGVPVYEVASLNSDDGKGLLRRLEPDVVLMESRELLDREVLAIPRLGFIGCHPGILPDYRGVYAPFWARSRGEPEKVGWSIYRADDGLDAGALIAKRSSPPQFPLRHFKVESERLMVEGASELLKAAEAAGQDAAAGSAPPASPGGVFTHIGLSDYVKAAWRTARGCGTDRS